jgi:mono/diheme cytochrome c family protein
MKNKIKTAVILLIFATCLFNCSKKEESSTSEFNLGNIKEQVFKINLNQDTVLQTESGVLIKLRKNTFKSTTLTAVELRVKEILTKADLIKSGISTIDEQGRLLETGGMVNIQTNPKIEINPKFPIQVSIPANGLNPSMKKYTADIDNRDYLWNYAGSLVNNQMLIDLKEGEKLFLQNCATCHNKGLVKNMTGPALGCIENGVNRRDRDWLIKFTKNSQKMIASGDTLALCIWNMYKPTVMSNFGNLSDLQINQIYDYIKNESSIRNLCDEKTNNGRNSFNLANCDFKIENANNFDTIPSYYVVSVFNYEWINCDYTPFQVEEEAETYKVVAETNLQICLIFKNRKSIWSFVFDKGRYVLSGTQDEEKVKLPIGEEVSILAYSEPKKGKRKFCRLKTKVNAKNDFKLDLHSISEREFLKRLVQL